MGRRGEDRPRPRRSDSGGNGSTRPADHRAPAAARTELRRRHAAGGLQDHEGDEERAPVAVPRALSRVRSSRRQRSLLQGVEQFFDPLGLFSAGSRPSRRRTRMCSRARCSYRRARTASPTSRASRVASTPAILCSSNRPPALMPERRRVDRGDDRQDLQRWRPSAAASPSSAPARCSRRSPGYTELIWYANPPEGRPDRPGPTDRASQRRRSSPVAQRRFRSPTRSSPSAIPSVSPARCRARTRGSSPSSSTTAGRRWDRWSSARRHRTDHRARRSAEKPGIPPDTPAVIEDATGAGTIGSGGRSHDDRCAAARRPAPRPAQPAARFRGETVRGEVLGAATRPSPDRSSPSGAARSPT